MRVFSALLLLLTATVGVAAPKADLWDYWLTHDERSTQTVNHSVWSEFLGKYLAPGPNGINLLDYGGVQRANQQALSAYINGLSRVSVGKLNRDEQRAYWINLYNALTVQVVLQHYPVKSIRDIDISPGLFSSGPWGKKLLTIEGQQVSLDDIEHRILRPIWKDPRIHYAVNCASIGCPNLQREAFTAANTESLLNKGAREYVNHPRGARVASGRLYVSSIYEWFQEDFGGSDRGVIEHLKHFAEAGLKQQLNGIDGIADDDYDWSLNDLRSR